MSTLIVTVPDDGFVTLYGIIKDVTLQPVAASKVIVKIDPTPQRINNTFLERSEIEVLSNEEGYFECIVPAKTNIVVSIPDTNDKLSGITPFGGTLELRKLGLVV